MSQEKKKNSVDDEQDSSMIDFQVRQANTVANLQYELTVKNLEINRLKKQLQNKNSQVKTWQNFMNFSQLSPKTPFNPAMN